MGRSGEPVRFDGDVRAVEHIIRTQPRWRAYLRAMRLERWPRSLSIAPGWAFALIVSHRTPDLMDIVSGVIAYLATLGTSVFNYTVNEIVDLPYDVHHPIKRNRPLVQGLISRTVLLTLGTTILGISAILGWWLNRNTLLTLSALVLAGVIYNIRPIRAKDIPFIDAIAESVNNPIRFLIGWYCLRWVHRWPSVWILIAWWAFGAFLMYIKRFSEKMSLRDDIAQAYRRSLYAYSARSLRWAMGISACVMIAAVAVAAVDLDRPRLYWMIPLLAVYALWIYIETAHRPQKNGEPEALLRRPQFLTLTILLTAGLIWSVW